MCSPLQVLIKSWTWEKSVSKSGMFGMENFTNLYEGKVKTGSEYTSNFFYTVHESKKDCRLYKTVSTGTSFNLNTRGRNLDLCDILLSHEPRMHRYTKQKMTQSHSLDQWFTYNHWSGIKGLQRRAGYSQHSQDAQGVLLDVQGPQYGVQVGQVLGQQLPALVDQFTQLCHLTWYATVKTIGKQTMQHLIVEPLELVEEYRSKLNGSSCVNIGWRVYIINSLIDKCFSHF